MTAVDGNRIYLMCMAHPDTEHSIMLGMRHSTGYFKAPQAKELNRWFDEHSKCVPGLDHFKLGLAKPADWDKVSAVDKHVKLALVKSSDDVA